MTTKYDLTSQIMQKLFKAKIYHSQDGSEERTKILLEDKKFIVLEIPAPNLLSHYKFFIVILRNREKTLIFETTESLNRKQLDNIVNFMRGIDVQNINHVRRYDKNRFLVSDGFISIRAETGFTI